MTRTRTAVGIAVGAAVAGSAVFAVVAATSASAGTPSSGTFTVRAHHVSESTIDLGRKGFSAGDDDLFSDMLTRGGVRVGFLDGSCRAARVARTVSDQLCEFDLHLGLPNQITASGAVRAGVHGPGTFTLPITGGTGRYRGASGQLAITATNGNTLPITISLDH